MEMRLPMALLALTILCPQEVCSQTKAGAVILDFEGSFGSFDDDAYANVSGQVAYLFSNSVGIGGGVRFSKSTGSDAIFGIGIKFDYLINRNPGIQKTIPRASVWWFINSQSDDTTKIVGSGLGIRRYLNKSVGISGTAFFERHINAITGYYTIFPGSPFFSSTSATRDNVSNFGVSWGFFIQFL